MIGRPVPRRLSAALRRTLRALRQIRPLVAPLSPRHRRWRRFLHELPLDPDALPRPLEEPPEGDFIICGSPRTGTTLLCAMLFQPPEVITVMEPWDGMRLSPAALFRSLRDEIERTGRLSRGRLDVGALQEGGAVRWCREGTSVPRVAMTPDAVLGVKWPGYWRYLELLPRTRFLVCLRDPVEVITSFRLAGGRVREGLQYDTAFNRDLNRALTAATDDPAVRRVLLFDYVHERILPFLSRPNVLVVRYERWFDDRHRLLDEIAAFLGVDLDPGPVRLQEPRSRSPSDPRELSLIRRYCRTAAALGYPLDRAASRRTDDS